MITLEKLQNEKKSLSILKKFLIGTIAVFFTTLIIYFFIINLRYGGYNPHPVDIYFYIIMSIPFSLLVLCGVLFLVLRIWTAGYVAHYIHYIKTTFFDNTTVKRDHFAKLLGTHEENLRHLGFNYTVKEFTYENFIHAFQSLKKKEKLHQVIKLVGIDEVYKQFSR